MQQKHVNIVHCSKAKEPHILFCKFDLFDEKTTLPVQVIFYQTPTEESHIASFMYEVNFSLLLLPDVG